MEPPSQRKTSSELHIMHLRTLTRSPLQVDVERRNYSLLLVIRLNAKHSRKARSWPNGLLRCRIFQREYIPTGMRAVFAWARVNSLDFHVFLLRSFCRVSLLGAFFVGPCLQSSRGRRRISSRELISGLG